MREARAVAAVAVALTVAGTLSGCGLSSWCAPLIPTAEVKASFAPERAAIRTVPGVVSVTTRYFQPSDSHCVDRDSLKHAAWATDNVVKVKAGATAADVSAVAAAVGSDSATVDVASGGGLSAWSVDVPLLAPTFNSAGTALTVPEVVTMATSAAALPGAVDVDVSSSTTFVRVSRPSHAATAIAWIRQAAGPSGGIVGVGAEPSRSVDIDVGASAAASEPTITAVLRFLEAHGVRGGSVSSYGIMVTVETRAEARAFVDALDRTPASVGVSTGVTAWWPDGNGQQVTGTVGSRTAGPSG